MIMVRCRELYRRSAPLRQSSQRLSILPVAVGVVELALGCLLLARPDAPGGPLYPDLLRRLSRAGTFFVAGGIFTLLSLAVRSRRLGAIQAGLTLIGALPLAVVAVFTARSGVWTGSIVNAVLVLGVLADAVRPARAGDGLGDRILTLAAVMATAALAFGVMALGAPHLLHPASYRVILDHRPLFGASMVAASALLVLGWLVPRLRAGMQVAAALPFWGLAAGFAAVRGWSGVVLYALLGSFLAVEPVLSGLLEGRAAERTRQPQSVSDYEFATEAVAWGFALLVALVGSADSLPERRLGLSVVAFTTSIFTVIWFHLRRVGEANPRSTVIASAVYSFLGVLFVELTGGALSPYFFVYFLPIIALAWTRTPHTIVVPLSIPLAALLAEIGLALRGGLGSAEAILFMAVPRSAGLLLIAGFAFLLARRNLETRRRVSEARRQLEAVLTHMGEGLVTTDPQGRVTLCNPAAAEFVGCTPEHAHGRLLSEVLPLRKADGTAIGSGGHPLYRALAGQRVAWERLVLERPQGALPLVVTVTPLAGPNDARGAIMLLRDARAQAEIDRVRDDFLFIASHELRTPLTVMKGNLEMALESSPAPALRGSLAAALGSTTRLIRLVNDFLDAARLEHGQVSLRLEDERLPGLVRQAVETFRSDADRKGLTLTYRAVDDLPPIRMDVERTLQILINLVGNSVRYTQHGEIEIWHEVDGRFVETLVRDSGIGIAPEHHDRLFTRFGQIERGLTRTAGGSGLGLYISRKLAEQMGGTVVLKASAPGQGSTFALRLPAAGVPASAR